VELSGSVVTFGGATVAVSLVAFCGPSRATVALFASVTLTCSVWLVAVVGGTSDVAVVAFASVTLSCWVWLTTAATSSETVVVSFVEAVAVVLS